MHCCITTVSDYLVLISAEQSGSPGQCTDKTSECMCVCALPSVGLRNDQPKA